MQLPENPQFEYAPTDRLDKVAHLADRFFHEILGYEFGECLVTDESDVYDFTCAVCTLEERHEEVDGFRARFREHYLLEPPTDVTIIVELLEFLDQQGAQA